MLTWLSQNISTIVIGIILLVVVIGIVFKMINDKKKGKSSCGCSCSSCAMSGACHNRK